MATDDRPSGIVGKGSSVVKNPAVDRAQKDMKIQTRSFLRFTARQLSAQVIALTVLGFVAPVMAQQVLVPPPSFLPAQEPAFSPLEGTTETEGGTAESTSGTAASATRMLQWGLATLHPRLSYGLVHADGIQTAGRVPFDIRDQKFSVLILRSYGPYDAPQLLQASA